MLFFGSCCMLLAYIRLDHCCYGVPLQKRFSMYVRAQSLHFAPAEQRAFSIYVWIGDFSMYVRIRVCGMYVRKRLFSVYVRKS